MALVNEFNERLLKMIDEIAKDEADFNSRYIPIEWINKWAENGGNEPVDDFTDVDAYCDGYQKNVIECMLKAWERENES